MEQHVQIPLSCQTRVKLCIGIGKVYCRWLWEQLVMPHTWHFARRPFCLFGKSYHTKHTVVFGGSCQVYSTLMLFFEDTKVSRVLLMNQGFYIPNDSVAVSKIVTGQYFVSKYPKTNFFPSRWYFEPGWYVLEKHGKLPHMPIFRNFVTMWHVCFFSLNVENLWRVSMYLCLMRYEDLKAL